MHELTITQNMVDIAVEQAEAAGANQIKRINLVVGQMSGIVEESVQFYFGFINKDTIAEGATLNFKTIPTTAKCLNCGTQFELPEYDWVCPSCHSTKMEIVSGKELFIESIEVE